MPAYYFTPEDKLYAQDHARYLGNLKPKVSEAEVLRLAKEMDKKLKGTSKTRLSPPSLTPTPMKDEKTETANEAREGER